MSEQKNSVYEAMLSYLESNKGNSRVMANLRCGLSEATEMYAWPHLALFCSLKDNVQYASLRTVAGLYATHPQQVWGRNVGDVCRLIQKENDEMTDGNDPMERRFLQLLDSDQTEICSRVVRIVIYAKSKGIGLDYAMLGKDLRNWNDSVRRNWANAFWMSTDGSGK